MERFMFDQLKMDIARELHQVVRGSSKYKIPEGYDLVVSVSFKSRVPEPAKKKRELKRFIRGGVVYYEYQ